MDIKTAIQQASLSIESEIKSIYRYLHQHPELSFEEINTAKFITRFLQKEQILFRDCIGGYGILARIEGRNPANRIIALRADMDALRIEEENDIPFRSQNKGVMHACGHDAHVACLLGTIRLLSRFRNTFEGTVLCLFQPAEERHPGGARLMLQDGVFRDLQPDLIIGQHVNLDLHCGEVAIGAGVIMASADEFHLTVCGAGGHGAMPHRLNDTVLAASQIVVALQQISSRRVDPFHPVVVTVGRFMADGATNIIPDRVSLSGTLRCMYPEDRDLCKVALREIITQTAQAHGCSCRVDIKDGYPPVINSAEESAKGRLFLMELLGKESVKPIEQRMTAEDFGFYSAEYPALFYRLGVAGYSNKGRGGQHTATFLIDEDALRVGVETLTFLALRFLNVDSLAKANGDV